MDWKPNTNVIPNEHPFSSDPLHSIVLHTHLGKLEWRNQHTILETITKILEIGADPTVSDENGQTTLHILIARTSYDVNIRRFLDTFIKFVPESERGAYINAVNSMGKSAIFYAESPYVVSTLLDLHADPFHGDPTRAVIFHGLLQKLNSNNESATVEAITKLLELGVDPQIIDETGQTALHILAKLSGQQHGRDVVSTTRLIDTIMRFVKESEATAYINSVDAEGRTALFHAMMRSSPRTICKLLDFSADPLLGDPGGSLILYGLLRNLYSCDAHDALHAITKLLECGCDPTVQDERGQTALHILSKKASTHMDITKIIDTLMTFVNESERSAYVNRRDVEGKSAIFYADATRIRQLLKFSADPFLGDSTRSTILWGLFRRHQGYRDDDVLEVFTRLLELGANLTVQDRGETLLHMFVKRRRNDNDLHINRYIDSLMRSVTEPERSASMNTTDRWGNSAIFHAAAPQVCKLLDFTADPFQGDPSHSIILYNLLYRYEECTEDQTIEAVNRLLDLGADPMMIHDEDGETALHIIAKMTNLSLKYTLITRLLQQGVDSTILDGMGNLPLNYLGDSDPFDATSVFLLLRNMVRGGYRTIN